MGTVGPAENGRGALHLERSLEDRLEEGRGREVFEEGLRLATERCQRAILGDDIGREAKGLELVLQIRELASAGDAPADALGCKGAHHLGEVRG